jgi:poly(A) polymerase
MNFMNVKKMRLGTLKRLMARPTIETELELHRIDCMASHGNCDNYDFVKEHLAGFKAESLKPLPLIGGKDLIDLGLRPGPLFGEILDGVYDLQLEETVSTREEALAYVREHYIDT